MKLLRAYSWQDPNTYNPWRPPTLEDIKNAEHNGMVKGALFALAGVAVVGAAVVVVKKFSVIKAFVKKTYEAMPEVDVVFTTKVK